MPTDSCPTPTQDELRGYLLGGSTSVGNDSFERLFSMLDLNGDGVISRQELRDGYVDVILGEARDAALQYATSGSAEAPLDAASAQLATAADAVVVCGYGEMGQAACDVLADAEGIGGVGAGELREQVALPSESWGTQFIAFDRNPSRVSIGLAKQVRVVYVPNQNAHGTCSHHVLQRTPAARRRQQQKSY